MQDSECFRTRLLLYSILSFSSLSILKSNLKTWTQLLSLRVCLTLPLPPHKLPIHVPQPWPHLVYLFADFPKDERFPICDVSFQISSHAWGVLSLPLLEVWNSFFSKRGNACIQHILMSVLQYQAWFCSCWFWKKKRNFAVSKCHLSRLFLQFCSFVTAISCIFLCGNDIRELWNRIQTQSSCQGKSIKSTLGTFTRLSFDLLSKDRKMLSWCEETLQSVKHSRERCAACVCFQPVQLFLKLID